jgi:hypothetical protein
MILRNAWDYWHFWGGFVLLLIASIVEYNGWVYPGLIIALVLMFPFLWELGDSFKFPDSMATRWPRWKRLLFASDGFDAHDMFLGWFGQAVAGVGVLIWLLTNDYLLTLFYFWPILEAQHDAHRAVNKYFWMWDRIASANYTPDEIALFRQVDNQAERESKVIKGALFIGAILSYSLVIPFVDALLYLGVFTLWRFLVFDQSWYLFARGRFMTLERWGNTIEIVRQIKTWL